MLDKSRCCSQKWNNVALAMQELLEFECSTGQCYTRDGFGLACEATGDVAHKMNWPYENMLRLVWLAQALFARKVEMDGEGVENFKHVKAFVTKNMYCVFDLLDESKETAALADEKLDGGLQALLYKESLALEKATARVRQLRAKAQLSLT